MTIANQTSRIGYTGDGATTTFPVPFYFQANADLVVYSTDTAGIPTLQALGTNYTLTGATSAVGGICTFLTAPLTGYILTILRDPPLTQTTSYNNNDPFPAKSHELALDKAVTIDQRTRDLVGRAIHIADSDATATALAPAASRKNTLLGFGTNGELIYPTGPTFVAGIYTGVAYVDSQSTAQVTTFPVSVKVVRTGGNVTAGDGGGGEFIKGTSTGNGAFQDGSGQYWVLASLGGAIEINVMNFIPAAQFTAIYNGTTTYDATAAINAAVEFANGADVHFPIGTFRTQKIVRLTSATDQWRNGMKLIGQGRGTNIVLTQSGSAAILFDVGYVPDGTSATAGKYTRGSVLSGLLITQAVGVTNGDGLRLTAAWNLRCVDVWIEGMTGNGINVPWRADIYAAVSDYWQCFCLDFQQCSVNLCALVGVNFVGGQSPGLWRMQFCTIANCAGGGIMNSTGQFVFTDNLVVANGTFGGTGGFTQTPVEGAAFNALIERNEFDTNLNYHIVLLRVRNWRILQNRFLSQTYNSNTGAILTTGSAFMRPAQHIRLADGTANEVWNCLFESNYHRTVTGAGPTTASVLAYVMFPGSTQVLRNRFINNDMIARDGVNQNSSGMVRYSSISTTGDANSVIEGNPVGLSAAASVATSVAGTATPVTFGSTVFDTHTAFSSTSFTAPYASRYRVVSTIQMLSLTVGAVVTIAIYVNAAPVRSSTWYAGLATQSFGIEAVLALAETDVVTIRISQNSGSNKNTTADSTTRLDIAQE